MPLDPVWILVTRFADTAVIFFFTACVVVYFLFRCQMRKTFQVLGALMGVQIVVQLLKISTKIPRPDIVSTEALGYAFPSGHAATGAVFYGLLGLWLSQALGSRVYFYTGFVFSLAIGYSRIALGVHTPFQVAVGLLIGWLFVFAVSEHDRLRKN